MGGFHRYQSLSYEVKVVFFSSIEVGCTKIDKISAFRNKSSFHKLAPQGERLLNFRVKILKLMEHCQKAHVKAWKLDFPLAAVKKKFFIQNKPNEKLCVWFSGLWVWSYASLQMYFSMGPRVNMDNMGTFLISNPLLYDGKKRENCSRSLMDVDNPRALTCIWS